MAFYKKIYPASWQLIKNNLILLVFGFFAAFLGFNEVKILFAFSETSPDFFSSTLLFWARIFTVFPTARIDSSNIVALIGLVLIFVIMMAVCILAISSQAALIKASVENNGSLKNKFAAHLNEGLVKFWPLFGLHLVNTIIGYFFVLFIIGPLVTFISIDNSFLTKLILSIIIFFILFPLTIIISFITRYGMAYVVLKKQKFGEAFINSWTLFKSNWLITIENAIFISAITVLYLVAMATAIVFAFTPFFILSLVLAPLNIGLYYLAIMVGIIVGLIIFLVATSLFGAYYNIAWAKVFIEITGPGKTHSKIYRIVNKHLPRLTR